LESGTGKNIPLLCKKLMPAYRDYHKILGIGRDAGPDEIKQAYRSMAKKYHPDINDAPDAHERFIEITEAYEILINRDLHEYYIHREQRTDSEFMRARYEQARREAQESARRYSRMKFEKFQQEQEAFKKSGWHDLILVLRYMIRILIFPVIAVFFALPLISEEVSEHPTGYVIFWLLACLLIVFVINHWKGYLKIDAFYYHLSDIRKFWKDTSRKTQQECYYCPGQKAMVFPYKIQIFRIHSIQLQTFGSLDRRKAGSNREIKTVLIPRSRRAFIVHALVSMIKISVLISSMIFITRNPYARLSLPIGIVLGGAAAWIFLLLSGTRSKVSYLVSYGMMIKFSVWFLLIWFFHGYAFIFLFLDPMLEALLRLISADRLFIPLIKQYPALNNLFRNHYQLYMELPVFSVISPLFRWLL
jgi:hypothetical protein